MTTPSGGLVGDATIRVRADTDPAQTAIRSFARTAQRSLVSVGQGAGSAALSLGGIGAAAGSAVPVLAGVAAAVQSIVPAAAGVATGFLAIQSASAAVQLGMIGVEDAITAAFETGEGSAEAFQESLEGLSPSARSFVVAIRDMRGEFSELQQSVQEALFTDFDAALERLSNTVLPEVQNSLVDTASSLNVMALGAAEAAAQLSEDGVLGQALEGANQGLRNLETIPAQVVTAFGQLASAGSPAFDRLTQAAADVSTRVSDSLTAAFETGRLQESVEEALDILGSLAEIGGDAFGILQNVIGAVTAEGDDLFLVLGTIVEALESVTGTEEFQEALADLAETVGTLARTAAPLLISALEVILPIFSNLADPVQTLVESLGDGLSPIIEAIGPVLDTASRSLGQLITAVSPLLPIVGDLIAQLGPILTPALAAVGNMAQLIAPVLLRLATTLSGALQPVLEVLPSVIQPILDAFSELLVAVLPLLDQLITAFTPLIDEMSLAFVDLLIALEPVITSLILLAADVLVALTPVLLPLIDLVVQLSQVFNIQLVAGINNVLIPALNAVAALLRGDFSGALRNARETASGFISTTVSNFALMPSLIFGALGDLGSFLVRRMADALRSMGRTAANGVRIVGRIIGALPNIALGALGDLGGFLFRSGRALIQGFIDGIRSLGGVVRDAVGSILGGVSNLFPRSPAREGPFSGRGYTLFSGQALSEDFARGIREREDEVRRAALDLVSSVSLGISVGDGVAPLSLAAVPGAPVSMASTPVTLTLVNQGVMGSRAEVLDWLTGALEDLRRRQRLPSGVPS